VVFFLAGYLAFAAFNWGKLDRPSDLLVPGVFFFGAVFVWLVTALSLQTVVDLKRMSTLEHENITDALMGIHNRRYLDSRLDEEVARAKRYGLELSVLLMDIDHFKEINDRYGHQVGDLTLANLGRPSGRPSRSRRRCVNAVSFGDRSCTSVQLREARAGPLGTVPQPRERVALIARTRIRLAGAVPASTA